MGGGAGVLRLGLCSPLHHGGATLARAHLPWGRGKSSL